MIGLSWTYTSIPILFQVSAPDHLRPLPGDDGKDSDGKAAQLHVWAVCNGERLSRLHCHQPLHNILCQQLRQRDTCQLCEWLACQTCMYGYLTSTNNWSIKTYLFIFLIIYIHLANPLDHPFRWAERCANWEKGNNNFRWLHHLTWENGQGYNLHKILLMGKQLRRDTRIGFTWYHGGSTKLSFGQRRSSTTRSCSSAKMVNHPSS